jgi:hypothetical protein
VTFCDLRDLSLQSSTLVPGKKSEAEEGIKHYIKYLSKFPGFLRPFGTSI